MVKTGSSYLSQSELPLTFGLNGQSVVDTIRVSWPSGQVDSIEAINANQFITVREGVGVVERLTIPVTR